MYNYVKRFQPIESKDNPKLTAAAKLCDKKHRRDSGEFAVEGIKLLREALDSSFEVSRVFVSQSAADKFGELERLEDTDIPVYVIPDRLYLKLSEEKAPQGIFTVILQPDAKRDIVLPAIMLCGVQDPGNVGTTVRTACAFGIRTVILAGGCADIYSSKTLRAAMGGVFRINTPEFTDPLEATGMLKSMGATLYAATLSDEACDIKDIQITLQTVFVLGSEGSGLPPELIRECDSSVIIPLEPESESLNVAVCGTVLMWELRRSKK